LNFENDQILKALNRINLMGANKHNNMKAAKDEAGQQEVVGGVQATTMANINEYIVSVLKNVVMPEQGERFDFGDLLDLCALPSYKFV